MESGQGKASGKPTFQIKAKLDNKKGSATTCGYETVDVVSRVTLCFVESMVTLWYVVSMAKFTVYTLQVVTHLFLPRHSIGGNVVYNIRFYALEYSSNSIPATNINLEV